MRFRDKHIRECKQAILEAVRKKRDAGEMTWADSVRVRTAFAVRPKQMATYCEDVLLAEAIEAVPAAFVMSGDVVGEIDWDKLADFIERILPVVLEFIKQLLPLFV